MQNTGNYSLVPVIIIIESFSHNEYKLSTHRRDVTDFKNLRIHDVIIFSRNIFSRMTLNSISGRYRDH